MTEEPSIKQMLASIGIEVRPAEGMHRKLVRTATSEDLGLFTASEALAYYHANKPDTSGLKAAFDAVPPVGDIEELAQIALEEAFPAGVPTDV